MKKCHHCKKTIAGTPVSFAQAGRRSRHYHEHHAHHHSQMTASEEKDARGETELTDEATTPSQRDAARGRRRAAPRASDAVRIYVRARGGGFFATQDPADLTGPAQTAPTIEAAVGRHVTEHAGHFGVVVIGPPAPRSRMRGEELPAFAARALAAARLVGPEGRFPEGQRNAEKIYIYAVAEAMGEPLTSAFRARLVEAHRANLLSLSRADLVSAMTPEKVAASETAYLNATFHFVRLPSERGW